jgi:hypothetical protein
VKPARTIAVAGDAELAKVLTGVLHELVAQVCAPVPMAVLLDPASTEDICSTVEIKLPGGRVLTGVVALGFEVGEIEALDDLREITLQ